MRSNLCEAGVKESGRLPTTIDFRKVSLNRPRASTGARGKVSLLLPYQPPYDWLAMLAFLRWRAIAGVERVTEFDYARTIVLDGDQGTVHVRLASGDALRATICFPKLSALPVIIARLRQQFDLDADPVAIGAHLARDPILAPLVAARPGLRAPGAWGGYWRSGPYSVSRSL